MEMKLLITKHFRYVTTCLKDDFKNKMDTASLTVKQLLSEKISQYESTILTTDREPLIAAVAGEMDRILSP
jgi:hypothetical protein